jgi:hypothetical protein
MSQSKYQITRRLRERDGFAIDAEYAAKAINFASDNTLGCVLAHTSASAGLRTANKTESENYCFEINDVDFLLFIVTTTSVKIMKCPSVTKII